MAAAQKAAKEAAEKALRATLNMVQMTPEDLAKVQVVPAVVGFVGIFVNLAMFFATHSAGWLAGTGMRAGIPYKAEVGLDYVVFGEAGVVSHNADTGWNCNSDSSCGLQELCDQAVDGEHYPNGVLKNTPSEVWCELAAASSAANAFFVMGQIPGFVVTGLTIMFALTQHPAVDKLFKQAKSKGMTDKIFKFVLAGCWGAFWAFLFFGMTAYAAGVPDNLGYFGDAIQLEGSYGMMRFSFLLVSIFGSMLVAQLFELWTTENVVEAWTEFLDTPWISAKKALYLELMLQMFLYFFLSIYSVDWAMLLVIFAGFYLDTGNNNFKLMYFVFTGVSILLDITKIAHFPAYTDTLSPMVKFGCGLYIMIFLLKFLIIGTIVLYEKFGDNDPRTVAPHDPSRSGYKAHEDIAE